MLPRTCRPRPAARRRRTGGAGGRAPERRGNPTAPRNGFALVLVPALLVVLSACARGNGDATADDPESRATDPGYSATDARIVETGPDGQPRYALRAATIRQDPRSLEVNLERLSMQVRDAGQSPWTLTADGGRMPEDATRIDLAGDVQVAGSLGGEPGRAGGETLQIRSESLRYEFGPARVTSEADVTVNLGGKQLEARGLEANLKQRQVRLESNVHGRFVP